MSRRWRDGKESLMPSNRAAFSTTEFAESFYKIPALMIYRVRCGKPNCHCAGSGGHGPYGFLHWRDRSGRQCRRYVRKADVQAVSGIIAERRAARRTERIASMVAAFERRRVMQLCREMGA